MKNTSVYITKNTVWIGQEIAGADAQAAATIQKIDTASLNEDAVAPALKGFLKAYKITPEHLTLCIPRTQVSFKYLTFPASSDPEIRQMVEFELNNLFPYKPEEMVFDYVVTERFPEGSARILLVAVQRKTLMEYVSILGHAGLTPDEVDVSTISLLNQFRERKKPPANYLLVSLDDAFMEFLLISGERLVFTRGVSFNAQDEGSGLAEIIDLTATIARDKECLIDTVILSSQEAGRSAELAKKLESAGYRVEVDDSYGVVMGLPLRDKGGALKINLLPDELKIQKVKFKRKKSLIYLGVLALLNLSLLANIVFLRIKAKQEYVFLLKSEINKIDAQASVLQKKLANLKALQGYLGEGRRTLGLLTEIYRAAPAGVSLSALDISNKKNLGVMVISGQTGDSETVLKFTNALKSSPLIKKADVNYIKKRRSLAGDQAIDFEIKASF